ncbi:hypothetical protein [Amycolatopsis sp. NPDC059657]|uniref:hypothetical protein n=1 Tax=Amycolatopsis sp. NPDC059657 TaxID=3346899 RepID=UPI00366CDEA1
MTAVGADASAPTGFDLASAVARLVAGLMLFAQLFPVNPVGWIGETAVVFLLLLSGFTLTPSESFHRARFPLLIPLFVLTILGLLFVPASREGGLAWLVAAYALGYACFPYVARALTKKSGKELVFAALGCSAAIKVFAALALIEGIPAWLAAFAQYSPFSRLPLFILGMVAAEAVRRGWRMPGGPVLAAATLVLGWLLTAVFVGPPSGPGDVGVFQIAEMITLPGHALVVMALRRR